ncbi:MAG: hypothetical protein M1815_003507 [Lichina confinis]|nr:MAG: hypothetical protein M1815_003507 [Lichina confinis]
MLIKALTSQRSKPKARQLGPFRGKGYLQVRDFPIPYITRGLVVGLIPAGWLDSYGEWTVEENDRAVFEAKGTTIPGIVVIDSPHGSCFIRTKDNLLDCKAEAGTTRYDTNWGKAIRVSRKHVVQEFSAGYKPQAPTSVPLTAVHNDKPAGHRVFVEWVPMKGDGTQPLNF